jgi:hypothetical protein
LRVFGDAGGIRPARTSTGGQQLLLQDVRRRRDLAELEVQLVQDAPHLRVRQLAQLRP